MALVFAILVWALVEAAAIVGFFAALVGERIERCSSCHRYGLTSEGVMHAQGCPDRTRTHVIHAILSFSHRLHVDRIHAHHH
ncbi:MAG: hypothetical protein WCF24_13125 [Acidimicrobiales bacterium]